MTYCNDTCGLKGLRQGSKYPTCGARGQLLQRCPAYLAWRVADGLERAWHAGGSS